MCKWNDNGICRSPTIPEGYSEVIECTPDYCDDYDEVETDE